jgi:hypothetical protein
LAPGEALAFAVPQQEVASMTVHIGAGVRTKAAEWRFAHTGLMRVRFWPAQILRLAARLAESEALAVIWLGAPPTLHTMPRRQFPE